MIRISNKYVNGFVGYNEENSDIGTVFEFMNSGMDSRLSELEAIRDLTFWLWEQIGYIPSKYDKYRLFIHLNNQFSGEEVEDFKLKEHTKPDIFTLIKRVFMWMFK